MANIPRTDYNDIQSKVESIIGPGTAQRGYGQPVQSSPVASGTVITALQYDNLRYDIVNIKFHQDGVNPFIRDINRGDVIGVGAGDPKQQYNLLADICIQNKFNIATGQYIVTTKKTETTTSSWSVQQSSVLTVTFPSAPDARYFFNSGSKVRFNSSRTGGATSDQNSSWTNLLSTIGTYGFGADTGTISFYQLTDVYQQVYIKLASSTYSSNNFTIDAKCDVSDNTTGLASTLTFRVRWTDAYVDPDTLNPLPSPPSFAPNDVVDGTLSLIVEELKATGPLLPDGTFSLISPTYSLTSITGS